MPVSPRRARTSDDLRDRSGRQDPLDPLADVRDPKAATTSSIQHMPYFEGQDGGTSQPDRTQKDLGRTPTPTSVPPTIQQESPRLANRRTVSDDQRKGPRARFQEYLSSSSERSKIPSNITPEHHSSKEQDRLAAAPESRSMAFGSSSANITSNVGMRGPMRDTSLESSVSSQSSTTSVPTTNQSTGSTHTHNTSIDLLPTNTSEADVQYLIEKHGSPETVIARVLEAQQKLTIRNEQLWKLVEKQRTMILGQQKDIEKLAQERERYKRKLKAQLGPSPLSTEAAAAQESTEAIPQVSSQQPANDTVGPAGQFDRTREPESTALRGTEPDSQVEPTDRRKQQAVPAALTLRQDSGGHGPASSGFGKSPRHNPVSPSMTSPGGDGRKKAPPTPLKLAQPHSATTSPVEAPSQLSLEQIDHGRGRRKTREDDDRHREASHAEEQRRSKSSKQSASKGPSTKDANEHPPIASAEPPPGLPAGVGLPSSPRAPLLGALQSPGLQPTLGSIAGVLGPQQQRSLSDTSLSAPPTPSLNALKSPGLPMSPRPSDRPMNAAPPRPAVQHTIAPPLMSPGPMSARGGILSPRPPRQPLPIPAQLGGDIPPASKLDEHQQTQKPFAERSALRTSIDRNNVSDSVGPTYHGFMSDEYPELPITPKSLPHVYVGIHSSRMRPSRNNSISSRSSEDDNIFTLAVHSRTDQTQLWRLEKTIQNLTDFDYALRRSSAITARLPEKGLFAGHAPVKVDQRRAALGDYFSVLLGAQHTDAGALIICSFLSTDAIGPKLEADTSARRPSSGHRIRMEGYLTKKGKHMGGWKVRYFVLDGKDLQYYDIPGGECQGTVRLSNAQIGAQRDVSTGEDSEYRHGIIILEQKRDDSSTLIRHALCAESDEERDRWINALKTYVESSPRIPPSPQANGLSPKTSRTLPGKSRSSPSIATAHARTAELHSVGYDQTVAAEAPVMGTPTDSNGSSSPNDNIEMGVPSSQNQGDRPAISGPVAGGPIQNAQAWGNKSPPAKEKRKIFGFRSRPSEDNGSAPRTPAPGQQAFSRPSGPPIFRMPLAEAAQLYPPYGVNICLPSVVYRCIEFMEARQAELQEGLFRVSGSQTVIHALKDRFDHEGDVLLLTEDPEPEIMAVADLLRLYCRELPEHVLTRELLLDFYKVMEVKSHTDKIAAYNVLVHRLPEANFELLATICRYLLQVVANADKNKMHERNSNNPAVATIWSGSFNVPFPLMAHFITEHEAIFGDAVDEASSPVVQSPYSASSSPVDQPSGPSMSDLRSPRKQMFSDLATPAAGQSQFPDNISSRLQPSGQSQQISHQQHQPSTVPQQTYRSFQPIHPSGADQGFGGSLNAALAPTTTLPSNAPSSLQTLKSAETTKEIKKARRESGLKNLISAPLSPPPDLEGKRKSSMGRLRELAGGKEDR